MLTLPVECCSIRSPVHQLAPLLGLCLGVSNSGGVCVQAKAAREREIEMETSKRKPLWPWACARVVFHLDAELLPFLLLLRLLMLLFLLLFMLQRQQSRKREREREKLATPTFGRLFTCELANAHFELRTQAPTPET